MKLGSKKQKNVRQSSAEVIDDHLILSLTNAVEPVVWRMELNKIGTASFEIKEIKASGNHKLVLKPKKGTAETIATFETKDEALVALTQASTALQNPVQNTPTNTEQKINVITPTIASTNETNAPKSKNKWLWLFLGFLVVIGLYSYLMSMVPNRINNFGSAPTTNSSTNAPSSDNRAPAGVPLSADDLLGNM